MPRGYNQEIDVKHSATGAAALGTPRAYLSHLVDKNIEFSAIDAGSTYDVEGCNDLAPGGDTSAAVWVMIRAGITATGTYSLSGQWKYIRVNTKIYGSGTGAKAYLMGQQADQSNH